MGTFLRTWLAHILNCWLVCMVSADLVSFRVFLGLSLGFGLVQDFVGLKSWYHQPRLRSVYSISCCFLIAISRHVRHLLAISAQGPLSWHDYWRLFVNTGRLGVNNKKLPRNQVPIRYVWSCLFPAAATSLAMANEEPTPSPPTAGGSLQKIVGGPSIVMMMS